MTAIGTLGDDSGRLPSLEIDRGSIVAGDRRRALGDVDGGGALPGDGEFDDRAADADIGHGGCDRIGAGRQVAGGEAEHAERRLHRHLALRGVGIEDQFGQAQAAAGADGHIGVVLEDEPGGGGRTGDHLLVLKHVVFDDQDAFLPLLQALHLSNHGDRIADQRAGNGRAGPGHHRHERQQQHPDGIEPEHWSDRSSGWFLSADWGRIKPDLGTSP